MADTSLNTQSIFSRCIDRRRFSQVACSLAESLDVDIFCGNWSADHDLIGIEPCSELLVDENTSRADIADFVFSDDRPTFGYLSYEYGYRLKGIPSAKRYRTPLGHLKKYRLLLQYNRATEQLAPESGAELPHPIDTIIEKSMLNRRGSFFPMSSRASIQPSLSEREYKDRVNEVLELIRGGHTYQINLSIEFSAEIESLRAERLFQHLWDNYPAPYYALFRSGNFRIISTSPERFLTVSDGAVMSQPIKGTLEYNNLEDVRITDLTESPKESAELSMIVDLIRNDISLNCEYGSVRVEGHKSTFAVDNLLQMYSNVHGRLRDDRTSVDLLLDAFPGGSITGCPKLRTMEIIDQMEPHARDVYCGTFFVIGDKKNMQSSIAIRTGYYDTEANLFRYFAGSGIVIESDPEREYLETLAKTSKFRKALGH